MADPAPVGSMLWTNSPAVPTPDRSVGDASAGQPPNPAADLSPPTGGVVPLVVRLRNNLVDRSRECSNRSSTAAYRQAT